MPATHLPRPPECPLVAVCNGKDCRKGGTSRRTIRVLEESARPIAVGCLDVCSTPVVVVDPLGDRPVVVGDLDGAKARRDLGRWVAGGEATDRLRKRLLGGKAARRARSKAAKSARRHLRRAA
jgi:hypothetical protein